MKTTRNSFLIVITVALLFAGFSLIAPAQNDMGRLTPVKIKVSCDEFQMKKDVSKSVKLSEHGRLEVTLCSNPSTGYQWSDSAQISNHSVLWQTSHTTSSSSGSSLGAPGEAKWEFKALDEGKSTISLEYGRSWQSDGEDNWSISIQVNVIDGNDIDESDSDSTDADSTGENLVRTLFKDVDQQNVLALKSQISDNFQGVSESSISDRKDELNTIRDSELEDYKLSDFHSTRQKDTLVVTYKLRADETVRGEDADDEPVNQLSVFVKTDSNWEWIARASAS
ncbi:MAG: protease inhibitor I42 family protein [Candidatus Bipolaricaulota bacterium]|nr:protease inhibitor I42 family protein [Candidatus Bipolaricaulota bacterium]